MNNLILIGMMGCGKSTVGRLAAEKLGVAPGHALVLEDSYNGVRAGARGGFVTVMVPDLAPADDEMRRLYTAECKDLHEVKKMLEEGKLLSEA